MDFVSPFISPFIDLIIAPIKEHVGYLVSSKESVEDMRNNMKTLNSKHLDIQDKKKAADVKNHEVSHLVLPWLDDVEKLNEDVEKVSSGTGCFNVVKRYKAGKRSSRFLKDIETLKTRETEIPWTNVQKSLARISSMPTHVSSGTQSISVASGTQNNIESRDLIFKDALKALQPDSDPKMIALCGMGGVGKTTMMKQLKKVAEDLKMFNWIVDVVLGDNIDINSLQDVIAQYISADLINTTTKDTRAALLCKSFEAMSEQGKQNILVIMDDVWKTFDHKDVGLCPLPKGAKILFTSRYQSVCTKMGVIADSIFNVNVLNEKEANTLFFESVGLLDGDDPNLQDIGEDIVKICGGLPIAIVTIAKVLRGNIKDAWKETLFNLENHDLQDLEKITERVFELSYNNLEREDDKAIFLLSGLFPEDFNISIEDLMLYGWGLNLFTKVRTLAEARRKTNVCVHNLIRANLLTESQSVGCVKIHDLTRAFVLSNFSKVKQASVFNHDNMSGRYIEDAQDSYERILLKCKGMNEFHVDFTNHDNLSLLILVEGNKSIELPKDLHKGMDQLEVVSYEGMYIPLLPVTFVHSTKLRTLCFYSCSLIDDNISFISSLSNLEILRFVECGISMLPSTIGKLKKLKLLDLTGCVNLRIEDGVFRNLGYLEELYMRASPGKPIRFTDANCEEFKLLSQKLFALELEFVENKTELGHVSFTNLERFRISIGYELKGIEKNSFRNTLDIVTDCNNLQECNIRHLFEKTEELQLQVQYMNRLEDISMQHTFPQLRVLHVSECADLTYLFSFSVASGLRKLERLTVSKCPIIRTLVGENSGVRVIKFPKLNFMSLIDLPKLVSLCDDTIELPEMMELRLDGLPNFTSIYWDIKCEMQSLFNKEVVLPKFEKLCISKMENLKQIWSCDQTSTTEQNDVSMLKEIAITQCDSLTILFPCNPLPLLFHLEELEVKDCGSIEVLFNIDVRSVGEMEGYISRLRSIKVEKSGKLKELWRMRGVSNSDILISGFKRVEIIEIKECEGFTSLFTPTTTNFDLEALTTYTTLKTSKQIDVTYPSNFLHTSHHLQRLELLFDNIVGGPVFDMDSPSSRQLPTVQPSPLLLPYLEHVQLFKLKEMSHVWKCRNWNAFLIINPPQHHQPQQLPFQNLTMMSLTKCHKIKYLFSPLMAKYLSNLKNVQISSCKGIEEVISSRDDESEKNATCTSLQQNIAFFPQLDTLVLEYLPGLKSVDDGSDTRSRRENISFDITNTIHDQFQSGQVIGACWSFCLYPKRISVSYCDALGSLIPWYVVGKMERLQELEIKYCKRMMEIFESESINYSTNDVDEGGARDVTTLTPPTLRNITSTIVVPQLFNLKSVLISGCDLLPHIFTFSTLESLKQLKELKVKNARQYK